MYGFLAEIVRETAKAVLVRPTELSEIRDESITFWLPKSQIDMEEIGDDVHVFVEVREWLARRDETIALAVECDCGINPIALDQGAYSRRAS